MLVTNTVIAIDKYVFFCLVRQSPLQTICPKAKTKKSNGF